jgi:CheY-like chemotaxis protein
MRATDSRSAGTERSDLIVGKPSVLVIDDDLSCRVLAALLLEVGGYRPLAVASVARALEKLDAARFDVVLTDLHMPVRSGLDLLLELRVRDHATPVVVMTGSADDELLARAADLGAVAVLPKPFGPAELRAAISAALDSPEARPVAA